MRSERGGSGVSTRKRKAFEQVRVGLLDHLPLFAGCPDAFLLFMEALLRRELDGPDASNYYVHQADLAAHLGWTRKRTRRAIAWLLEHPDKSDPYLLLVKRGTRGRAACYHINRAGRHAPDCGSDRPRIHGAIVGRMGPETHPIVGPYDPETQTDKGQSKGPYDPETPLLGTVKGPVGPRNTPITRARLKEPDEEESEGSDAMKEVGDWVIVTGENEARQVLLDRLGIANIEDGPLRQRVLDQAMDNLQHYHIAFEEPDDPTATPPEPVSAPDSPPESFDPLPAPTTPPEEENAETGQPGAPEDAHDESTPVEAYESEAPERGSRESLIDIW